nr:hypothetical protein CFP56_00331 [Quercus suber]
MSESESGGVDHLAISWLAASAWETTTNERDVDASRHGQSSCHLSAKGSTTMPATSNIESIAPFSAGCAASGLADPRHRPGA